MKIKKKVIIIVATLLIAAITSGIIFGIPFLQQMQTADVSDKITALEVKAQAAEIQYDDDGDEDQDGLTNKEEQDYGTNMFAADTDKDQISDKDEIELSKTDPTNPDSDGDGIKDGLEARIGLDPLSPKSDGIIFDAERDFEHQFKRDNVTLKIKGKAPAMDVTILKSDDSGVRNHPGALSDVYEFFLEGAKFDEASVTFKYSTSELKAAELTEEDIAVYQFLDDGTFKKVGGEVDTRKHTITASLPHFSKYLIGSDTLMDENLQTDVFFLLDNSGSMYYEDIVNKTEYIGIGNDPDGKRLDLAKAIIEASDDSIHFGAAKFTGTYTELNSGFKNNKKSVSDAVGKISEVGETWNGTYIRSSLKAAINNNFSTAETKNDRKFIILLTDGETTEGSGFGIAAWGESATTGVKDISEIAKLANKNNVCIITIGLGNDVNSDYLNGLAMNTGGFYVHANNADALEQVKDKIFSSIRYNFIDTDKDGENDKMLLADTGFVLEKDGWSFPNYNVYDGILHTFHNGQCYGMASIAQLYYRNKLPLTGESISKHLAGGLSGMADVVGLSYDLRNIEHFTEHKPLHDYQLYGWNGDNSRTVGSFSTTAKYSDDLKSKLCGPGKCGIIDTKTCKPFTNNEGKKCDSYETLTFDLSMTSDENDKNSVDNYNVLRCINNYFSKQQFGNYDDTANHYPINGTMHMDDLERLCSDLRAGIPMVVSGNGHAINAIALYRDLKDPFSYSLVVYDNNHPDKELHMTIKLEKINLWHKTSWGNYNYDLICTIYDTNGIFGEAGQEVSVKFLEIA